MDDLLNYRFIENNNKEYLPFMSVDTVDFFDHNIKDDMTVFEWGSGGSTIYFAQKVKNIISVENDQEWFNFVSQILKERFVGNYNIVFSPKKEEYINHIDQYNDLFDIVIVDGMCREDCLIKAQFKVKIGGWLIFHDYNRPELLEALNRVNLDKNIWEKRHFGGKIQKGVYGNDAAMFVRKK